MHPFAPSRSILTLWEFRGLNFYMESGEKRSSATLAVASGVGEEDIQKQGEWFSKAWMVYDNTEETCTAAELQKNC